MIHEILVIEDEENLIHNLKKQFKGDSDTSFKVSHTSKINEYLLDIPSLIIINEDKISNDSLLDICKIIRDNEDNSITPIMVLTSDTTIEHERSILKNEIEFYLVNPIDDECLFYTIQNILRLLDRNRGISPLTKLPRKYTNPIRIKKAFIKKKRIRSFIF